MTTVASPLSIRLLPETAESEGASVQMAKQVAPTPAGSGGMTLYFEQKVPRRIHETTREWSVSLYPTTRSTHRERLALERLTHAREALRHCVDFDPDRYGGAAVIAGTRFPVSQVLAELAEGASIVDLAEDLSLDRAKLSQVLSVLSAYLDRPR
jgi:uncharacterized protein (DUF433 family)